MAAERALLFSRATRQNTRYCSPGEYSTVRDNEDRVLLIQSDEEQFKAVAIFDGHDGALVSDFAYKCFEQYLRSDPWYRVLRTRSETDIKLKLEEYFLLTDIEFFDSLKSSRRECGPTQNVSRFCASGGCSAVLVIVFERQLYVANVGNTKAMVISEPHGRGGSLMVLQLSTDHTVNNKEELKRLEKLGLDPEELKRVGRLGPQENTRSIGDYNVKDGYKSVENLKHALRPPCTSRPSVQIIDITPEMRYLVLCSDAVYKSIEAAVDEAQTTGANQYLAEMVHTCTQRPGVEFSSVAQTVLDLVADLHEETYWKGGPGHNAVREDMTLAICKFSLKETERYVIHYLCKDKHHWVEDSFEDVIAMPQTEASNDIAWERKVSFIEKIGNMAEAGSRSIMDVTSNLFSKGNSELTNFSSATLVNAAYSHMSYPKSDSTNEDRSYHNSCDEFRTLIVLDGHKGSSCVSRVRDYIARFFASASWRKVISRSKDQHILLKLKELIKEAELDYFECIQVYTDEAEALSSKIPPDIQKTYTAYQEYPHEVARLEELEPLISGGCTAVVAVICDRKLYVANVGNSRAVVVCKGSDGALETRQLSVDHTVKNEEELKRLEKLGLDLEELKRVGRLGPQENTRSIGDYNMKRWHKSMDALRHASSPPNIAEPSTVTTDVEDSFLYLMLMSDGVYKSIEAAIDEAQTTGANQYLAEMVHTCAQTPGVEFSSVAQTILDRIAHLHEEAFQRSPEEGPQAAACCKRDDMTLLVYRLE